MNEFISIQAIIKNNTYKETPEKFFGGFIPAWKNVKNQVLKLETRQIYIEPGNKSYESMMRGNFSNSLKIMKKSLSIDDELYRDLLIKGVDFIRCRPIKYPMTNYLKWEMKTYEVTSQKGVRIFCCNYNSNKDFFQNIATHDFMVFDDKLALVHDYDPMGLIRGGWIINKKQDILMLQSIFVFVKSRCKPYQFFTLK